MSKISVKSILLVAVVSGFSSPSYGQLLAYGDGVSEEQSMRDQTACATWARRSSGYDPTYGSTSAWDTTELVQRADANRAAMFGAAIGGSVYTTGTGARTAAASGVMIGERRHREAMQQRQQSQFRNQGNYNRALAACLRGRGYTVN